MSHLFAKLSKAVFFCLVLFLVEGFSDDVSMRAQTAVDGAVAGMATDSSGAAIPNANVVVHNTATNAETTMKADGGGYFRVSRLVPGIYTVTVSSSGFANFIAQKVTVEVGKVTEVTPKLSAGGTATTVQVTDEVPVINTESSDFTSEFNPVALNTLPINGRHWTSFALLSPGVVLGNSAFGLVSFRGATNLQNNFLVDGSDDNESFQSVERGYTRVGYTTPEDAVLEFQVLTSNVPAQYGRAVGGGVNAVTKSGSNVFHGDAFEYWRDNDFGATNPFFTLSSVNQNTGNIVTNFIKPKDKRHQYGGAFSGPLIKDKLFFLYAFDQQKRNFPSLAVPTPQFIAANNAAYNNCKAAAGGPAIDAVSCAEARGVTAAQVNEALDYINGQSGVVPRFGNQIINFGKLDYKINDRNNVSLIYDRMRWDSPNGIQTNPVNRRGITSFGNDYIKDDSIIGKVDTLISTRASNELRIGYAREFDTENGDVPLPNEPTTTTDGLPPGINISTNSGFAMGTPSYLPRTSYPDERESDIVDNVTVTLGGHTLNVGGEYRWAQDNIVDVDYLHGLFNYSQLADFLTDFARTLGSTAGCDSLRDSGAGAYPCYSNLQQAFGRAQFVYHTNEYAAYIQDDWKVLPRLTLNLGLRYDYEQLPSPKIPNAAISQTAQMPSDKNNIAPRIGFAWDVFGKGKTLVHGGFGLYYGRIQNGTIFKALSSTGSSQAQFQINLSPTTTGAPTYPVIVPTATAPAISNVTAFAPGFQNPVSDQVDLSLQQDLGHKIVFGIAYLGSFGKNLPTFYDANIAPATTTTTYTFSGGPLAGSRWTVPLYTARNPGISANALTLISSSITSNYNALSLTLERRLANGVQVSTSYTWSKALDFGMNQSALSDVNDQSDPFSKEPDYGRSANDIPQRFVGGLTLQPTFKLASRYASLLANGWTLAPVWTIQSGMTYSYGLTGGVSIPGGSATYNGSGGTAPSAAASNNAQYISFRAYPQYFSADSFTGTDVSRNSLRGANIDEVDARLSRALTFKEKYKLTLSAEVFNILNRQQFTAYNTTAYSLSGSTATYQSSFGTPSGAGNTIYRERQIQLVGRFEF